MSKLTKLTLRSRADFGLFNSSRAGTQHRYQTANVCQQISLLALRGKGWVVSQLVCADVILESLCYFLCT